MVEVAERFFMYRVAFIPPLLRTRESRMAVQRPQRERLGEGFLPQS